MVFNNEMSKRLWEFSQMPTEYIREKMGISFTPPQTVAPISRPSSITENNRFNCGDININVDGIIMNGVNDKKEFVMELNNNLATNKDTIKIMQHNTVGVLGRNHNSLGAMRHL